MIEDDVLPKTKIAKDWLEYADKKHREFKDLHTAVAPDGRVITAPPLQDDYSKMLAKKHLEARKIGIDLLRKESKESSEKRIGRKEKRVTPRKSSRRQ